MAAVISPVPTNPYVDSEGNDDLPMPRLPVTTDA
jgi:hypothetical protein